MRDEINLREFNTTITLTGANGKRKKLWQENRLGRALRQAGHEIKIPFVTGHSTYEMRSHNLITNAGHAGCAGRLGGVGGYTAAFTYVALGTGTTAAAATDTALTSEITTGGLARAAATAAQATTNVTNDTLQLTYTWTASSAFAVTEEGVLDASSSGHLLAHQVFSAVNVASGDSIAVTHSITC
jgi:hypothetical protein